MAAPTQSGELTQTPKKINAGPDSYPPSKVPLGQPVGGWEGAQDQIHLESGESECTNGFPMVEIGGVGTTRPLVVNSLGKRKASVCCCTASGQGGNPQKEAAGSQVAPQDPTRHLSHPEAVEYCKGISMPQSGHTGSTWAWL